MRDLLKAQKIAVIGDLHGRFSRDDLRFFSDSGHDLLLFVGDLGSGTRGDALAVVRRLGELRTPSLVLLGNNDAPYASQMHTELSLQAGSNQVDVLMGRRTSVGVRVSGYESYRIQTERGAVTLIFGRPYSVGGPELGFPDVLERVYGVGSMDESAARLVQLVDEAEDEELIFVSHNGPLGLGDGPGAPFGRDFQLAEVDAPLDWGDRDLASALEHALTQGRTVLGVIAGHMHRGANGESRPLLSERQGVPVYNVAVVPRIVVSDEGPRHHYVELSVSAAGVSAKDCWVFP